jgi:hypothetical protein
MPRCSPRRRHERAGPAPAGRIEDALSLAGAGRLAFVPFSTPYPTPEVTVSTAVALAGAGADLLEIGIPFSDPLADGPVIQGASEAALRSGMTPGRALALVAAIRNKTDIPLIIMSYLNPVMQFRGAGGEDFALAARAAGAEGLLLTDLPPDQPHEIWDAVEAAGPARSSRPDTPKARLAATAARARGFVYCVSRPASPYPARRCRRIAISQPGARCHRTAGARLWHESGHRRASSRASPTDRGRQRAHPAHAGAADPVAAAVGPAADLIEALSRRTKNEA